MDQRIMCPQCRAFIGSRDRTCPYCGERITPRAVNARNPKEIIAGFIPHARFTTMMILLINSALFVGTTLLSRTVGEQNALYAFGAKFGPAIVQGHQWWRLVTAGFLHGGLLHIAMNSWVLFDLGAQVEEIYGAARLIVFYFVATVAGFALSLWWSPGVLSIGASAGLMGLIGAMIALGVRNPGSAGSAIRGMYIRWAVYILIFGLLPGFNVDNAAHIGGLAAGFGAAYIAGMPSRSTSGQETFWRGAAGVCLALTAFSFMAMYLQFSTVAVR
jgi:rhomboid protease GluP